MSLFSWKGGVFSSVCEASKLIVKWHYPREKVNEHSFKVDSDEEGDIYSDLEDIVSNQNSPPELKKVNEGRVNANPYWNDSAYGSTEIDLSPYVHDCGNIKVIANGFSFDPFLFIRVPVFLILIQDKSTPVNSYLPLTDNQGENQALSSYSHRLLLLGLSENNNPKHSLLQKQRMNDVKTKILLDSKAFNLSFKLIPLRIFLCKDPSMNCIDLDLAQLQNFIFVPNYGFLYVSAETATLKLHFGSPQKTEETYLEHFSCGNELMGKCKIVLFDVFNFYENNAFVLIALLSDVNDEESHSNSCIAMYFKSKTTLSKQFEMKHIEVDRFFPQEFSQILLSFTILSTVISRNSASVLSSSVIMISTTGFAILFSDGAMTHCIPLTYDTGLVSRTVLHRANVIDIQSKSRHQTAICINNTVEVIDWSKKKVLSSHSNVSFISKYDVLSNGFPTVLLLLSPKSGLTTPNLNVNDLIPLIIDGTEDDSEVDERKSPEMTKDHSRSPQLSEDDQEHSNITHNVLENLIFQEKKCQSELKEIEQDVINKEIFIENIQQIFSTDLTLKIKSESRNLYLQPLVPLKLSKGESPSQREEKDLMILHPKEVLKFGQLWKRTIDNLLICGIEVTNVLKACKISKVQLTVLPINPSRSSIHCTSQASEKNVSSAFQHYSPVNKKMHLENEDFTEHTQLTLNFGESASFTACTSTSEILGGENVVFKVLLKYKLLDCSKPHLEEELAVQSVSCGQFTLSVNDIIYETFSMKSRITGTDGDDLNKEDILALGCIQDCYDLEVKSVMTSVLSLNSSLKISPLVSNITWADQCIIKTGHTLQYCRLKWLRQNSKHEANLRVYARCHNEVLLFIQFLYNLSPKDITITISPSNHQPSVSAVKTICQSIIDKVDDSITQIGTKLSSAEQNENLLRNAAQKAHSADSSSNVQEEIKMANKDIHTIEKEEKDEELETLQKSPTFHSSASRRGRPCQINDSPGTSNTFIGDPDTNRHNPNSFSGQSNTVDVAPSLFDFDAMHHEPIKSKSKKGKGGLSKGKGKLMRKK